MRIRYNAPAVLSYALLSVAVLVADQVAGGRVSLYFAAPPAFDAQSVLSYFRMISHIAGHQGWTHLVANFSLILLIGPILEEKYHSGPLLLMMLVTALVTGVINVLFLDSWLMGASGVVFMMILLSSFTNIASGEIPLTFILVVVVYLAREVIGAFSEDSVAQFAHIAGGVCGSLFGFLFQRQSKGRSKAEA
jgi:membrane associated rhomboid family serine protease